MTSSKLQLAEKKNYLDEETLEAFDKRLARMDGQLRKVRAMVRERACADDILLQVAAIKGGLNSFAALLVDEELTTCVHGCMPGEATERIDRLVRVLKSLFK